MKLLFRVILAASFSVLCVESAFAGGSKSPQELASDVHQAILDKNPEAISALYNWEGVDPDIGAQLKDAIEYMVEEPVRKVEVRSLPDDYQEVQEMGDRRFTQHPKAEGVVVLIYSPEDDSIMASMLYGAKDGKYYFSAPIEE